MPRKKNAQKVKIQELKNLFELLKEDLETKDENDDFRTEFSEGFRDILYETMWTFINPKVIKDTFVDLDINIKISFKKSIDDDDFEYKKYHNTICFKGNCDEGHYVYVDEKGEAYGTYEKNLLVQDLDDGVCHGVAMIYAYNLNGGKEKFPIFLGRKNRGDDIYKRTPQQNLDNYRTILNFYLFLCNSEAWKETVNIHFGNDEEDPWTEEKNKLAIKTLILYLKYLNSFDYE